MADLKTALSSPEGAEPSDADEMRGSITRHARAAAIVKGYTLRADAPSSDAELEERAKRSGLTVEQQRLIARSVAAVHATQGWKPRR